MSGHPEYILTKGANFQWLWVLNRGTTTLVKFNQEQGKIRIHFFENLGGCPLRLKERNGFRAVPVNDVVLSLILDSLRCNGYKALGIFGGSA